MSSLKSQVSAKTPAALLVTQVNQKQIKFSHLGNFGIQNPKVIKPLKNPPSYLVLLCVDDEEDEHHQVLLVAAQVVPVLSGRDSVEYNQVLCVAHCVNNLSQPDSNVWLQIIIRHQFDKITFYEDVFETHYYVGHSHKSYDVSV